MDTAKVIPLSRRAPHPGKLRALIARLATEGRISFGTHAFDERRPERAIDIEDARRVMILGEIEGGIEAGENAGEWKCKMVAKAESSSRRIGVVTAVIREESLFVITVEWEDK